MAPAPGRTPKKNPSTDPLKIGRAERRQSSRVGKSPLAGVAKISCFSLPRSKLRRTSEIPKSPMITGTRPRPSIRV
jgi:hypothetical protein